MNLLATLFLAGLALLHAQTLPVNWTQPADPILGDLVSECGEAGPGFIVQKAGVGVWLFSQLGFVRRLSLESHQSAACLYSGAVEHVARWSWWTGQMEFVDAYGVLVGGKRNLTSPAAVLARQPPQPQLLQTTGTTVCVMGEARSSAFAPPARTLVLCASVGGGTQSYNVTALAPCLASYPTQASFLPGAAGGVVCSLAGVAAVSAPALGGVWSTTPARYLYRSSTAESSSFGYAPSGSLVWADAAGQTVLEFQSSGASGRPWIPPARQFVLVYRDANVFKVDLAPAQRAGVVVSTSSGKPCDAVGAYVRSVVPDAVSVTPQGLGTTRARLFVQRSSGAPVYLSVDVAAWTADCAGDSVCFADLGSDREHCGFCDRACESGFDCVSGACVNSGSGSGSDSGSGSGLSTASSLAPLAWLLAGAALTAWICMD
jgi:hypothetical protein